MECITQADVNANPPLARPDSVINAPAFTNLCPRNRGRFLLGLVRQRRGLDPTDPLDAEFLDAVDVETDRLCHLTRGCR